ncbi:hypothetical protein [Acinetobacter soli]|uniref:hypothetical protein n=1 Tax=Acinetobacter soli TaxID=487316 RepID=UPI0020916AB7|nr:hypothetical protein [Acinetobacter soli]
MHTLQQVWDWLGVNSGQIQILLAVIGLTFAVIAAIYAKKQIKLSQDQRLFELKTSILSKALECKDLIYDIKHQNSNFKDEFLKLLEVKGKSPHDQMDGFNHTYNDYLTFYLELLKKPEEVTNKLIKNLSDETTTPNLEELERYLLFIVNTKGEIYSGYTGMQRRIEDLRKINNQL